MKPSNGSSTLVLTSNVVRKHEANILLEETKVIDHFFCKRAGAILLFGFFLVIHGTGVSQAKLLGQRDAKVRPRGRIACYASATLRTNFIDPENLGSHGYRFNWSEKNGIAYTCRAGHVDVAHVRKNVDWTAYLAAKTLEKLGKNETAFSFKLREPSLYFVQLAYPENWKDLSQADRENIAYDISIRLGQYLTYTATTWHEILTWYGYKAIGFYPEFPSAFSWEDTFSNVLGIRIGAMALRDAEHGFNEAVTLALDRELEKLGVQPRVTAIRAAQKVRGLWFSTALLFCVDIMGRNFDIGLDDGFVTPWIIPSVSGCEGTDVQTYPVPNLDFLSEYGFSMKLEIEPREWEKGKILRAVYPDGKKRKKRIEPIVHFAPIMDRIKAEAAEKYGYDVALYHSGMVAAGDLNGDGKADFEDFVFLTSHWLEDSNDFCP